MTPPSDLEAQLEDQRKQQQVRALLTCPQPPKTKSPTKRPAKRPRLQRPASTTGATTATTLLSSPLGQQAALQPQQFTVLSPISLSSVAQPFTVAGLPLATLAQSPNTVTLLPAGPQLLTRYVVAGGDGKTDTITLHPSSGLLLGTTAVQEQGQLVSPLELVQLSQQAGGAEVLPLEGQVVDGTMLVQQGVMQAAGEEGEVEEAGQEHTVIEINPAPMEQAVGVMELQLSGDAANNMEVNMAVAAAEETQCQIQEAQTEGVQGLQLDASGHLSSVQIVVIGENTQEEKVK